MLRLVTSPPVVLMVALAVYGQVHAGTSPPTSSGSTTEQTSYQVLQAILKHDDPIRTIGRINQRFVLLTEKKNLFDLPASAWDNSSHKLKLDNVTTVAKHWPQLLSATSITLDPPDQSTLLAYPSSKTDQLLWFNHQAGSCPIVYDITTGVAAPMATVCGKQPGLNSPSTLYISSTESSVLYYYANLTRVDKVILLPMDFDDKPATICTSPLNYTVGFQDGPKYYLFSSQTDDLDIVDMATCQIESMKLSSFFVCTPDPTTPSTTIKFEPRVSSSSGGSNIGLIVGIVGGVIVALLLIGLAVWFFRKKRSHGSKPSNNKRNKESKGSSSKMAAATSSGSALKLGSSMPSGSAAAAPIVKNSKGTVKAKPTKGSVVSGRNKSARNKSARNKSTRTKSARGNSARVKSTRATVHKSVHKSGGLKIKSDNIPTAWHTDKIKESPPKAKALAAKTKAAAGGKASKQNRQANKRKTSKGGKAKAQRSKAKQI